MRFEITDEKKLAYGPSISEFIESISKLSLPKRKEKVQKRSFPQKLNQNTSQMSLCYQGKVSNSPKNIKSKKDGFTMPLLPKINFINRQPLLKCCIKL